MVKPPEQNLKCLPDSKARSLNPFMSYQEGINGHPEERLRCYAKK